MGSKHVHTSVARSSGRTSAVTLVQDDPTWALEYSHFKQLVASAARTDLANDRWLYATLDRLGKHARMEYRARTATTALET